ncbi:Morphogenesis-related protein [Yarrowia sp. C11]|nr:Morphogenesis-related protein [Yarrowia sp. E02]KAG5371380.1 Morphogenesis-related protein [Yarrowia sp. C11]
MVELTIAAIRDHYRTKRAAKQESLPYPVPAEAASMPSPNAAPLPPPKVAPQPVPQPAPPAQMPPSQMTNDFEPTSPRRSKPHVEQGIEMPTVAETSHHQTPKQQVSPQQVRNLSPPKMRPVKSLIPPSPNSKDLPDLPPPRPLSEDLSQPMDSPTYKNFFSSEEMFNQAVVPRPLVHDLVHVITGEIKARGILTPYLLLPFRPESDPNAVPALVNHIFPKNFQPLQGEELLRTVRNAEIYTLCGVLKWCWCRMPGGVVSWPVYERFVQAEKDGETDHDAFLTLIPRCIQTEAHASILYDFMDLLAAIATHGKKNGMGGRKLARLAGSWAFDVNTGADGPVSFQDGLDAWSRGAEATNHLFFSFLRTMLPTKESRLEANRIPRSLEALLVSSVYPPLPLHKSRLVPVPLVTLTVGKLSSSPLVLLKRAAKTVRFENPAVFATEDDFNTLFFLFKDPKIVEQKLSPESKRVLHDIVQENPLNNEVYYDTRAAEWKVRSSTLPAGQHGNYRAKTWSKHYNSTFTDPATGTRSANPHNYVYDADEGYSYKMRSNQNVSTWEEFKQSGFEATEAIQRPATALSGRSIPMNIPWASTVPGQNGDTAPAVKSGYEQKVTAAVSQVAIDDFFVWVWMSSLSIEQPEMNKALFGRSVVVEVEIAPGPGGRRWVVVEEILYPPPITPAPEPKVPEPKAPEPKPRPVPKRIVSTPVPPVAASPPKKKHTRRKSEKVITFEYDDLDPLVAAVADRIERRNSEKKVSPPPPPPPPKMADSSTQTYCDQQTQTDPVELPDEHIMETTPEPHSVPSQTSRDLGVQTMSTQSTRNSMATVTMSDVAVGAVLGAAAAAAASPRDEEKRPDSKSSYHTPSYGTPTLGQLESPSSASRSATPDMWVPDSPPSLSQLHINPLASEQKHQPLQNVVSMIIDSSPERTPVQTPQPLRTPKLVKRKPVGSAPALPAVADIGEEKPLPPIISDIVLEERPGSVNSGFSTSSIDQDLHRSHQPLQGAHGHHYLPSDINTPDDSEWGDQGESHVTRGPYNTAPYQLPDRPVGAPVPGSGAAPATTQDAPNAHAAPARGVAEEPVGTRGFQGPITVAATAAAATAAARAAAGGPPGAPETPISMAHDNTPSVAPSVVTVSDSEAYKTASTTDASPVYERDSRIIPSDISHNGLQISGIKNQKVLPRTVSPGVYSSDQSSYEYSNDYTDDSEYEHPAERGPQGMRGGRGGRGRGRGGRGGSMGGHMGQMGPMQRSYSPQGFPGPYGYSYGYWPGMMGPQGMGPQGMGMMGPQGMGMGMGPQGMGMGMGPQGMGMGMGMGMMGPQGMQGMGMMGPQGMGTMNPSPAPSKSSQSLPSVDSAFLDRGPMGMSSSGALKNVSKRHTPKRDLQSPASSSSGSSFGPLAGQMAGPQGMGMGPQGMGNMGMGMGMNNMGMGMNNMGMGMGNMGMGNMGNMAMMRQGMSPQHMTMMGPGMGPGMGHGPMGQGAVTSDSDSDANYYQGGPPRYLRKLGRGAEAPPDRKGSHSENRPPYGYPIAQDKGKDKYESPGASDRSLDSHPVSHEHQQDEPEVARAGSVGDSFVGSNVATVIASGEPTNSPHQSELTLKLEQTPVVKQAHPYASSQTYHVPTMHHSTNAQAAPESPPDTPTSGPTIQGIRKSWSTEYEQRQAIPPLPAIVTEDDIKSDTNIQTSLSTAMGVDDYVSASVHLNRHPSVHTGAHVSSVPVPLDDSPTANNVDQEKPTSRGAIEYNPYRVSAPPAPRDTGTAVQFQRHGRSMSTSQLNKALPLPPLDVSVANSGFSESTSSLGSAKTPTSGGSPSKRSSLFFRKNGQPSDEQLRELREQETLSKEHIVSWVDRRRPDGKRVFSAGPYDAI